MSNTSIKYLLELDASQAKRALSSFQSSLKSAVRDASSIGNTATPFAGVQQGAAGASSSLGGLAASFLSLRAVAIASAGAFAKASIDASEQSENAFRGLESVANRTGVGISKAWQAVQDLTSDGLMSQAEAATALKNLFSRGFGLEEAVALIGRFKDSAAFGRQAALGFGEAVVGATEGLKNENSALVDNAGVTKNVAAMWEDYAKSIGVSTNELTQAQKRQAEYNGVMKETAAQTGDSKKLQDGLSGANTRLAKSFADLKTAVGDELKPAYIELLNLMTKLLTKSTELFKQSKEAMKPPALVENKGSVGLISRGVRAVAGAAGIDLPPVPTSLPNGIPPLSTNKTGIKVVAPLTGPGGKPLNDNIDKAGVAKRAKEEADIKAKADAKQALEKSAKRLKLEEADARNSLDIYSSGLDAQRAVLEKKLAERSITQAEYARLNAELEQKEVLKAEELRAKRIAELRKQVELATKTGNADVLAEAQQNLKDEEAASQVSANKLTAIRTKASIESVEVDQAAADERLRIAEQLLNARIEAERTTAQAIRDREIAAIEQQVDERAITEEAGIRRIAELKDAELLAEIGRITKLQKFYKENAGATPSQQADATAQQEKLRAQATALETERVKLTAEANFKIAESARELARIRSDLERELLEVQGRTFDAQSAQIDAWLEEKRKQLAQFPELLAKAEAIAQGRRKTLSFEKTQDTIASDNRGFDNAQAELSRRSAAGLITDIDYDRESLALKKQQADVLRERLALLRENSDGSTSAVAAIQDLEQEILTLDSAMSQVAQSINEGFFSAVEQGFEDLFTGAKKPLDALKDLVSNVFKQIASIALRNSLQQMFAGLGGAGGGLGGAVSSLFGGFRATGGAVAGDKAYVTGERGMELFFPGTAGNVVTTARIEQVLSGMLSRKTASPAASFSQSREVIPPGDTNVSVAPKLVLSTKDLASALRETPEFENIITVLAQRNYSRIKGGR